MKEYILKSNRILNNDIAHSFCHELFGSGKLDGCLKFNGIYLTIRTNENIPQDFFFLTKGREIFLTIIKESKLEQEFKSIATVSGVFSYAKTDSKTNKKFALTGPKNIQDNDVCSYFFENQLGIKSSGAIVKYIEPLFIKETQIIHNIFSLQLTGNIVNLEQFKKATSYGIGQKKSYGFGFINIL
jgi:hypothetical protein